MTKGMEIDLKVRSAYFDNIKGIMIFFVVFCHCVRLLSRSEETGLLNYLIQVVYSFHMPVFVFVSGYFTKKHEEKLIVKYLIPYVVVNTIFGLLSSIIERSAFGFHAINPFFPNRTLWYLLSIFWWKVFLSHFVELKYSIIVVFFLSIFSSCLSRVDGFLSISRTIAFFPYFLAGNYLQSKGLMSYIRNYNKYRILILFLIVETSVIFFTFQGLPRQAFELSVPAVELGFSFWQGVLFRAYSYIVGTVGIVFFLVYVPNKLISLSYLGTRSITVYLAHYLFLIMINRVINIGTSEVCILIVSALLTIVICLMFGNDKIFRIYKQMIIFIDKHFSNNS